MSNLISFMNRSVPVLFTAGRVMLVAVFLVLALASVPGSSGMSAAAQEAPTTLDALLRAVRQQQVRDRAVNRRREAEFVAKREQQKNLLQQAERDVRAEESTSEALEAEFRGNERELARLEEQLTQRLGDLGELFGLVRQVAGETRSELGRSMISAQFPGRVETLEPLTRARELPTIDQLRTLWFVLQQEMTEQAGIAAFRAPLVQEDGSRVEAEMLRVGPFTALTRDGGDFVRYEPETGELEILPRQPASRFTGAADNLVSASPDEIVPGVLDPSGGAILGLLIQTPTLGERIDQGGVIGYIVIMLGVVGLLVILSRLFVLLHTGRAVQHQMGVSEAADASNPLGRVLAACRQNIAMDTETLELKLDEAILKEVSKLEWGLPAVRILAAVAPLLGLLGTVTGMIIVFQQITLFGTGDPKLMAGGISQALVTTVLGLSVAIPLLLLHSMASAQAKTITRVLEEQSAGLLATHAGKES